jgi:CubicO group peptidase (beta-lactamase class C family)
MTRNTTMTRTATVALALALGWAGLAGRAQEELPGRQAPLLLQKSNAADSFDDVRRLIPKELERTGVPSIAVAVARDGKIIWEEGFGWADKEKQIRATEHTMYSTASVSKPITATGLMVLVEAGKINLDRPIDEYLGAVKLRGRAGDASQATVRRVANHTAGLPMHSHFFYDDEKYPPPSMDETIRRYGNLVTIPGEKMEYSNLGYGILGYVIARTSGKPYEDFMRDQVFRKLGLTNMSVVTRADAAGVRAARYGSDGSPLPVCDFDHRGSAAVYASAHDLVRFGLFHLKAHLADQERILSDASIDEMQRATVQGQRGPGYGIGWTVLEPTAGYTPSGYRAIFHTGGMRGASTVLWLIPDEKVAVVVLCNGLHSLPFEISAQILTTLLPKWKNPLPPWQQPPAADRPAFHPPAELTGAWSGKLATYKADLPFSLRITESGEVEAQLGDQAKTTFEQPRWENGELSGRMQGDIGTEDANRGPPYFLLFKLKLRGNVLNGSATAIHSSGSSPSARAGVDTLLTQWVEVRRQ